MPKDKAKERERRRLKRQAERRLNAQVNATNQYGFTDLTPYNAINGTDHMSKPTLYEARGKGRGSFNG